MIIPKTYLSMYVFTVIDPGKPGTCVDVSTAGIEAKALLSSGNEKNKTAYPE